ncbi:hypothetical protein [Brevibacterium zhoupengii]|uniref:hypothetical protein n=1 Tax=Brevibacterium zhoupengii TaxID=2898795 RepID=UPI001E634FF9|nr:hypothetical protein [Brevibacterium zhoupengii]
MSPIASLLMVAAAIPCLVGSITARSRLAIVASSVMLLTMIDLAFLGALPPVIWSGLLLLVGLCVAVRLRSRLKAQTNAPAVAATPGNVLVGALSTRTQVAQPLDHTAESSSPERPTEWHKPRPFPRLGTTSAILSAAAYPIMAWQVLNHRAHHGAGSGTGGPSAHQHHGHSFDGSLASGVITLGVIIVALLLALFAVQAATRRRPGLAAENLGMATMLTVMQFLH